MQKAATEREFTKRRTAEAGLKLADAAHVATWRLYCEVLALWRLPHQEMSPPSALPRRAGGVSVSGAAERSARANAASGESGDGGRSAARSAGDASGMERAARAAAEPDELADEFGRGAVRRTRVIASE